MSKKLTLVVHGIGEQAPGETLHSLTGSLIQNRPYNVTNNNRDLYDGFDKGSEDRTRTIKQFPCQTVWLTQSDAKGKTTYSHRFSEVYWADLSRGGSGLFSTLFDVFRTVLGLGYIAKASAEEFCCDGDPYTAVRYKPILWMTNKTVDAMHGIIPVVALTLAVQFLFLFLFKKLFAFTNQVLDFFEKSWSFPELSPVVATLLVSGGICILASQKFWPVFRNYLFRVFLKSLRNYGYIMLGLAALVALFGGYSDALANRFNIPCEGRLNCTQNIFLDLGSLILNVSWAFVFSSILLVTLGVSISTSLRQLRRKSTNRKPIIASTLGLMALLTVVLISILWAVFVKTVSAVPGFGTEIQGFLAKSLGGNIVAIGMLGFFLVGAVWVVASRLLWVFGNRNTPIADQKSDIPRIILNDTLKANLTICSVSTWGAFAFVVLFQLLAVTGSEDPHGTVPRFLEWLNSGFGILAQVSALATAAYVAAWQNIGMIIGVLKDIVGYFAFEEHADQARGKRRFYAQRNAINNRLNVVLKTLVTQEKPDELNIISHSQGTVLALETLAADDFRAMAGLDENCEISLLTMGSPTQYIYATYFKDQFNFEAKVAGAKQHLLKWFNYYRIDDFVGLDIQRNDPDWPINRKIPANGHTGYWSDPEVRPYFVEDFYPEFQSAKQTS